MIQGIKSIEKIITLIVLLATIFAIFKEFQAMYIAMTVTLADLLLLFIYVEVV